MLLRFLSFAREYSLFLWASQPLSPIFVVKRPDSNWTNHFSSLVLKVFLQHLLALTHSIDPRQPSNRTKSSWGLNNEGPSLSSGTNPPHKISHPGHPQGDKQQGQDSSHAALSVLIVSWVSDLLGLALSGKVCIIWQSNSKILIYCKLCLCRWLLSGLPFHLMSPLPTFQNALICENELNWLKDGFSYLLE